MKSRRWVFLLLSLPGSNLLWKECMGPSLQNLQHWHKYSKADISSWDHCSLLTETCYSITCINAPASKPWVLLIRARWTPSLCGKADMSGTSCISASPQRHTHLIYTTGLLCLACGIPSFKAWPAQWKGLSFIQDRSNRSHFLNVIRRRLTEKEKLPPWSAECYQPFS